MRKNFVAASLLLNRVWYAEKAINTEKETIDFAAIKDEESKIVPSSTEKMIVKFAFELYSYCGICDFLGRLDRENQLRVIRALNIMIDN